MPSEMFLFIGLYLLLQLLLIGLPIGAIRKLNKGILTEDSCRKSCNIFLVCFSINLLVTAAFTLFSGVIVIWLPALIILKKKFRNAVYSKIDILSNIPKGTSYNDVIRICGIQVAHNFTIELKMPYGNGHEVLNLGCYFDENDGYKSYSTGGIRVTYQQRNY